MCVKKLIGLLLTGKPRFIDFSLLSFFSSDMLCYFMPLM